MKGKWSALALVGLFVTFQLAALFVPSWPPNFQPLLALAFCSLAFLGRGQWWIPVIAWAVAWPLLSWKQGYTLDAAFLVTALALAVVFAIGWAFRRAKKLWVILGGVTLGALSFYFITNTVSFFQLKHIYPQTLEGFIQAQWTGPQLPGFGPTWVFLRNSIGASLLFTSLFFATNASLTDEEEETEDEAEPVEA